MEKKKIAQAMSEKLEYICLDLEQIPETLKYVENINFKPNIGIEENEPTVETEKEEELEENMEELKYYNEYGGFSENGLEYKIKIGKDNKLPTAWSMILANPKFGTLVTQNIGGFTWHKNSRLNRLSAWNNEPVLDIPSEIIYLKNKMVTFK